MKLNVEKCYALHVTNQLCALADDITPTDKQTKKKIFVHLLTLEIETDHVTLPHL